jgi:hypothetical protein
MELIERGSGSESKAARRTLSAKDKRAPASLAYPTDVPHGPNSTAPYRIATPEETRMTPYDAYGATRPTSA